MGESISSEMMTEVDKQEALYTVDSRDSLMDVLDNSFLTRSDTAMLYGVLFIVFTAEMLHEAS